MGLYVSVLVVITILIMISQWLIFVKAARPGWAAIIPVFNVLVLLEIINKPWWWVLLMMIPGLNIIFMIWTLNLLSKCFGKNESFTIGLIILPFIFIPILGFGDSVYENPVLE